MRILHLAEGPPLENELGRHLSLLLRGLRQRGVDIALLTTSGAPTDFAEGMPLLQAGSVSALARAIRARRPDLVHLHAPFLLGLLAASVANVPLIVSLHDGSTLLNWAIRLRARRVLDGLYGVDLAHLDSPDDLGVAALRQVYATPLVLSIAPWSGGCGLETLLDAWSRLSEGMLLLVGAGPRDAALRDQVRALGLTGRVAFLSPPSNERLPNLYHAADLFVQPAPRNGLGNLCLLEAQACGVPTVRAADRAGEEEGGLVVPQGDESGLAQALQRLLTHEPLRQRLGEQGKARARRDFNEERLVEAVVGAYRKALLT